MSLVYEPRNETKEFFTQICGPKRGYLSWGVFEARLTVSSLLPWWETLLCLRLVLIYKFHWNLDCVGVLLAATNVITSIRPYGNIAENFIWNGAPHFLYRLTEVCCPKFIFYMRARCETHNRWGATVDITNVLKCLLKILVYKRLFGKGITSTSLVTWLEIHWRFYLDCYLFREAKNRRAGKLYEISFLSILSLRFIYHR